MEDLAQAFARRAIERSTTEREAAYVEEIRRLVEAAYRSIAKTGSFDPPMRDILKAAGLSTQAFYRHFRTKDELMLVLLDNGRRRLLEYLDHRMNKVNGTEGRLRAWIEGVLAQAADPGAAKRTKPFVVNQDRLAERFPGEQQASFDLLIGQLTGVLRGFPSGHDRRTLRHDAEAIYHAAFGALRAHLINGTRPTSDEIDHLVRFCLNGATGARGGSKRQPR
ncbi:MAG TPA: TetR/AcrR family transcriptional regulator [Actinomycetota bacterium]|nr:TetR/AcrR family transcriptional regulator [Actinomycetota bacterium]